MNNDIYSFAGVKCPECLLKSAYLKVAEIDYKLESAKEFSIKFFTWFYLCDACGNKFTDSVVDLLNQIQESKVVLRALELSYDADSKEKLDIGKSRFFEKYGFHYTEEIPEKYHSHL